MFHATDMDPRKKKGGVGGGGGGGDGDQVSDILMNIIIQISSILITEYDRKKEVILIRLPSMIV